MIIDGHAHACGAYYSKKSITNSLKEQHIDMIVLCPGEPNSDKSYSYPMLSEKIKSSNLGFIFNRIICFTTKLTGVAKHIDEQNKYVYELAKSFPKQIIQAYWINPLDNCCMEKLEKDYLEYDFKMLKLHQCWNKFNILSEKNIKIFEWATKKNMPVFIHLLSKKQVRKFVALSNNFPNTVIIVAHMIGFKEISDNSINTNIYYDMSAPQLISKEILEQAVKRVGCNRIILGSDIPYGERNLQINIERIKNLHIDERGRNNIMGGNIIRLLLKKCDF